MPVYFQTAPDLPEGVVCRTFQIPNSQAWLGIFNALRPLLTSPYNWEQVNDTDLTVDESIALVVTMFNQFWETDGCGDGGCVLPDIDTPPFRLGVNGRFQQLLPDGTWGEPEGEYAIPPTPAREEATQDERKCAAAANATFVLKTLYEAITDEIALGGDALQVAAAMVAALVTAVGGWIAAPVYAIIQLTIALFAGMIELLQALGADVWTSEFDEKLKCALLNCADDSGDVVTFDLSCIREGLAVEPNIFSPTIFYEYQLFAQILYLMETITADGLNAAGATTAITDANCDDCGDWCYMVDLSDSNGGFVVTGQTYYAGTYLTGQGWAAANKVIGVQRTILQGQFPFSSSVHMKHVDWTFNYTKGTNQNGVVAVSLSRDNFTEILFARNMEHQSNGTGLYDEVEVDVNASAIDFDIQCSHNAYGGSALLRSVTIRGDGDKPTFLEAMGWIEC